MNLKIHWWRRGRKIWRLFTFMACATWGHSIPLYKYWYEGQNLLVLVQFRFQQCFGLLATFCADKLNPGHFSWQDRKDKLCLGWIFTAHQPPRQRGGGRGGLVSTSWQIMQPFMAFSLNRHCQRGRQHKLCDDDRRRKKAGRVSFCLDPHVKMRFAGWGADMWKVVSVEAGMITL